MFNFLRRGYRYRPCFNCGKVQWEAKGSGQVIEQYGEWYVRQSHKCGNCGLRLNLVRRMKSRTWGRSDHEAILS